MKKYSKHIKILISLFISLSLIAGLTGCAKSKPTTISVYDLKQNAEGVDKAIAESNRELLKESFDREYKDKLYLEDFGSLNEELSEKYLEKLNKELLEDIRFPHFTRSEMKFYNLSLKELRDGDITEENVISNPEEHLRNFELEIFTFATEEERSDEEMFELDGRLREINDLLKSTGVKHKIVWRIYDSKVLSEVSAEEIENMEEPLIFLEQKELLLDYTHYMNDFVERYENRCESWGSEHALVSDALFRKYKIEFIGVGKDYEGERMYAPVYDLNMKFEGSDHLDRFLTLLSQKLLSDKVYEIIESENAGDYIGAFVVPNNLGNTNFNNISVDLSNPIDEFEFFNRTYKSKQNASLIYLIFSEYEIDYEVLKRISSKIINLMEITDESESSKIRLFVDFYIVKDENEKKLVTKLLYENRLTERYVEIERGLSNLFSDMYIRRTDNEAFKYLDIYCKKLDYILKIPQDPILLSGEEFKEKYKSLDKY